MTVDYSRALKLANLVTAGKSSDLEKHLDATTTVLTIDPEMPQAELTARVLLTTLRRGLGEVVLVSDGLPKELVATLEEASEEVDPDRRLVILREKDRVSGNAIRIHIGPCCTSASIRIVPEGFGAHVASMSSAIISPKRAGNALGAVFSASLGAAEVFKHAALVRPQRRILHRHLKVCPVALSNNLSAAPQVPDLNIELTLIGVGAIGTGIVLLLEELQAEGKIILVDRERFARENVGTYSIGGAADAETGVWKVALAGRHLRRFDVIEQAIAVDDQIHAVDAFEVPWTPLVMTALDSPNARRDAQRLWPDHLIDAQTGDTMLGFCEYRHGIDPCMLCLFSIDQNQPSRGDVLSELLGLSNEQLADPDRILTTHDLSRLTEQQRDVLRPLVGTPICGLARASGLSEIDASDFMPSVPFVSLQAACLSVARLIRSVQGLSTTENFVQYDALCGPQLATVENMKRRTGCICQARSDTIDIMRSRRRTGVDPL